MNNSNNKKIKAPTLIIKDNILKYKDSVIQISNITKCEIAPEPPKPYSPWLFIGLIIGTLLLCIGISVIESLIPLGIIIIIVCGAVLYVIYEENTSLYTYFILELCSGSTILFSSKEKDFLWEAQSEIISCFNNKKENCIINFSDCTITHSQIGEDNFMNNGVK